MTLRGRLLAAAAILDAQQRRDLASAVMTVRDTLPPDPPTED
ncbi:MAG: hypothetical protein Q4F65_12970 [Propionibacteriaceae bacterium]|nr:hypothetical protein [Propionibacteriaceae bacterium]